MLSLRSEDFVQDPHTQPQNPGPMPASGWAQLTSKSWEQLTLTIHSVLGLFISAPAGF